MESGGESSNKIPELMPDDILIAIMGLTGVGKSTFISSIVGEDVSVSHRLESHTKIIKMYGYKSDQNRNIYLIDTPGFDDTRNSATETLRGLAAFLASTSMKGIKLSGLVQLHCITDTRFSGSAIKNIKLFRSICGEDAYKHVILTTTMWNCLDPREGYERALDREQELKETDEYWGLMYKKGSTVERFDGTKEAALRTVNRLINLHGKFGKVKLQLQEELLDKDKSLGDTEAGQFIGEELEDRLEKAAEEIRENKKDHEEAIKAKDEEIAKATANSSREAENYRKQIKRDQEYMKLKSKRLPELVPGIYIYVACGIGGVGLLGAGIYTGNKALMNAGKVVIKAPLKAITK